MAAAKVIHRQGAVPAATRQPVAPAVHGHASAPRLSEPRAVYGGMSNEGRAAQNGG
jgi:hypothetical protein